MALLEIKNIKKSFDENLILNDVSLNVEQAGRVCNDRRK